MTDAKRAKAKPAVQASGLPSGRGTPKSAESIRIGVLGCGNVGAALVQLVAERRSAIAARTGVSLEVASVAVRNTAIPRPGVGPGINLTHDAASIVADPTIDIIVEVIGGIEPARGLILEALKRGKAVVTANKELLANVGAELFEAADGQGIDLLFEAAVAGGIPLIRPLRESLAGEEITRVLGIVNGTTNFILSRMADGGADYHDALAEAQQLGFAERDPTADVEGFDAASKAAIIATIAFGKRVVAGDVQREGISAITAADIAFARRLGFVIKLLAVAEETESGISVRVHPAMLPADHPLASVRDSFNAVFIEGRAVGQLMFYGRGAGGFPTASAVLGDVIDAAINRKKGAHALIGTFPQAKLAPVEELVSQYYVNLEVDDRPGVLAKVAGVFGDHGVSIKSVEQEGLGKEARLLFVTWPAPERAMQACLSGLRGLPDLERVGTVLRVIGS